MFGFRLVVGQRPTLAKVLPTDVSKCSFLLWTVNNVTFSASDLDHSNSIFFLAILSQDWTWWVFRLAKIVILYFYWPLKIRWYLSIFVLYLHRWTKGQWHFLLPSFYTSKQNDQRTSFRYSQVIKVLCIAPYAVETMHCKWFIII